MPLFIACYLLSIYCKGVFMDVKKDEYRINVPNKETLEALTNIEAGKDLVRTKDAEDLFKKLSNANSI